MFLWWTIRLLKSQDAVLRRIAADKLGKSKNPKVIEPLIASLDDADSIVRSKATEALVKIGDSAVGQLIVTLKSSDSKIQPEVARILGEIGNPHAVESLIALLYKYKENYVREEAAKALAKIGDVRAIEPLVSTFSSSNVLIRDEAAKALTALGYEPINETQKAIILIAYQKWDEIVKLGDSAVDPLIDALRYSDTSNAARTLGKIGDVRAIKPLIYCAYNRNSQTAINSLQKILEFEVEKIQVTVLNEILNLKNVYMSKSNPNCSSETVLDCSLARQLARQELIRRGIEA